MAEAWGNRQSGGPDGAPAGLDIVVVDDAEDATELFAELLRARGHRVRAALRGRDGLALVEQAPPALVFVDLGLPDLDGCEVAAAIRARHGGGVRLVALTGYSDDAHRERARRAGFDDFLVKPFQLAQLDGVLREAVPGPGSTAPRG